MRTTRTRRLTLIAALGALALALSSPLAAAAAAPAEEDSLQSQIDAVLVEYPGGTQTAPNEISWNGGKVILTLEDTRGGIAPLSVGSCATGYHCAYSGYALSGSKLSIGYCGTTEPTGALSAVRSVANAHGSGYVEAKNSGGGVLATIGYGGSVAYAPAGITQLTCVN